MKRILFLLVLVGFLSTSFVCFAGDVEIIHTGILEDIKCNHNAAFGNDTKVCMIKFKDGTKIHLSLFIRCEFPYGRIGSECSLVKQGKWNCYKILQQDSMSNNIKK